MNNYLSMLKELETKDTNYLIKLNLLDQIGCFDADGTSDEIVDMLYAFYIQGYWNCEHEFMCEIFDYCEDHNITINDLSYEELFIYFEGEDYEE